MSTPSLKLVSECFIKPYPPIEDSKHICYLAPWDIAMLSSHYIQMGLLFKKPSSSSLNQQHFIENLLQKLKHSLSLTLFHFYPLSGRLVIKKTEHDPPSYLVFVDCKNCDGAKIIHATLNGTINDILSPVDVPYSLVHSFFDHHKAINHEGQTMSLLSIQVTELFDGVFIGCSMNHCIADGCGYWNFFNAFSEIYQNDANFLPISHQPINTRWFPDGYGPIINLPFKHHDEFIHRCDERPIFSERIFHFSVESIAKLKAKANKESEKTEISSFQSLSALVWRSITRARQLEHDQRTSCKLAINNRTRMKPFLSKEYFGNSISAVSTETTAGELLENDLGWAAWKIHMSISNHDDKVVRKWVEEWLHSPFVYRMDLFSDPYTVIMSSSPRFNMYENEFGMGKAIAVRSGYANKYDGKITSCPGQEGGGSIDLEVCLSPDTMRKLEADKEFMSSTSVFNLLY